MWGSPEKTSDEVQKKSNNSRYLYRQLRHVEKELSLLGPSRFPNPDSFNRAMQQVHGMKGLLQYHLPSPSLDGDQLDSSPSPEESINGDSAKKSRQGGLPWWFVFVGWMVVCVYVCWLFVCVLVCWLAVCLLVCFFAGCVFVCWLVRWLAV